MGRKVGFRTERSQQFGSKRRTEAIEEASISRNLNLKPLIYSYNHTGEIVDPNTGEIINDLNDFEKEEFSFISRRRH